MKKIFWTISILLANLCNNQGADLIGLVVDSKTNEPLFGVTVICRDVMVAFSDDAGLFPLPSNDLLPDDVILFKHISYSDKIVTFSQLQADSIVKMENRTHTLQEITVVPVNYQKVIKAIVANYNKLSPAQPYWTKIHQAQTLTFRGELAGYVEFTGHMLCMGRDIKNPFSENKWFPDQVRRIEENKTVSILFGGELFARCSEHSIHDSWTEFRFFDVMHPLGKYSSSYVFNVDSSFTADGKDYWAISYQSKAHIAVAGWSNSSCGQMWIEKTTNLLSRITGSCNRADKFATQLDIKYGSFDNKVIPCEMHITVVQNKNIQGKKIQDKLMYESRISFTEAASRLQKKYKDEYLHTLGMLMVTELPFDPVYWSRFPTIDNLNFSENDQLPIYRHADAIELQEMRQSAQIGQQEMKKEITSLTWHKIHK